MSLALALYAPGKAPDKVREVYVAGTDTGSAWGAETDGLRAALVLSPIQSEYRLGSEVGLSFRIRNVSDHVIELVSSPFRHGATTRVSLHDENGKNTVTRTTVHSGTPALRRFGLEPGEESALVSGNLGISVLSGDARHVLYEAAPLPGRHSLMCRLDIPGQTPGMARAVGVPLRPSDWRGSIETGTWQLTVVPDLR